MTKGTLKHVDEEMTFEYFLRFVSRGNTVGGLLIFGKREAGSRGGGEAPENFETKPFQC